MGTADWERVSTNPAEEAFHDDHDHHIAHDRNQFPPSWAKGSTRSGEGYGLRWYQSGWARWVAIAAGAVVLISLGAASNSPAVTRSKAIVRPYTGTYSTWSTVNTTERTVVLYAYHETELTRPNAEFFIEHALHDYADFIFVVNGHATLNFPTHLPNVKVIRRSNTCYDLGAHGEVLAANDRELVKKYDKFILMNGSIRGPFMPHWSRECWSSAFTDLVTDHVKLAGLTMNCIQGETAVDWLHLEVGQPSLTNLRHVQAMLLATDRAGLALLLVPAGLAACPDNFIDAVGAEVRLSSLIRLGGYGLDAVMSLFQDSDDFAEACTTANPFDEYPGGMLHPHELMFVKSRAGDPNVTEAYSHFARKYDSRRFCHGP